MSKREYKFRLWNIELKRFISGDLLSIFNSSSCSHSLCQNYNSVLQQYIGIKDINDKEIYEGDIVRWNHGILDIGVIVYVDGDTVSDIKNYMMSDMGYYGLRVKRFFGCVCLLQGDDEYEIIGNVMENPILLIEEERKLGYV